jgi:hypothetical protein
MKNKNIGCNITNSKKKNNKKSDNLCYSTKESSVQGKILLKN